MEKLTILKKKIGSVTKVMGWINKEKKVFLKEVDSRYHLYRNHNSWNINWDVFKQLDGINGICIYDTYKDILYYVNADMYLYPKPRMLTNNKDKELQVWLALECFKKIEKPKDVWREINKIEFSERRNNTLVVNKNQKKLFK